VINKLFKNQYCKNLGNFTMRLRLTFLAFFLTFGICFSIGYGAYFHGKVPHVNLGRTVSLTVPKNGTASFLVVGDAGSGDDSQKAVAQLMERLCEQYAPVGVLYLGDNFYYHGVKGLDDPLWGTNFQNIYNTPCLSRTTFYPVLGNHDYHSNPEAQILYTKDHGSRWQFPARFYEIKLGDLAEFVAVDTNFLDVCGSEECSIDWADSALSASKAPWKIVMGHHPLLSGGPHGAPKKFVQLTLPKLFCHNPIDFYLSGHEHNFQHLVQERKTTGRNDYENCPIQQIVSGAGGYKIHGAKETQWTKGLANELSAGVLTLSVNSATYAQYGIHGNNPLYSFTQTKNVP